MTTPSRTETIRRIKAALKRRSRLTWVVRDIGDAILIAPPRRRQYVFAGHYVMTPKDGAALARLFGIPYALQGDGFHIDDGTSATWLAHIEGTGAAPTEGAQQP